MHKRQENVNKLLKLEVCSVKHTSLKLETKNTEQMKDSVNKRCFLTFVIKCQNQQQVF